MENPASVPVYVGAELDPSVGSIPQTPILTRSGSIPTEQPHPLAGIPTDAPTAAEEEEEEGDLVKQLTTRMTSDDLSVPLKKRGSLRLSTEGADMKRTVSFTFPALPSRLSSASVKSAGTRRLSSASVKSAGTRRDSDVLSSASGKSAGTRRDSDVLSSASGKSAGTRRLSSASGKSAGTRRDSDVLLPDCRDETPSFLSRSHTACSASTRSIHSSTGDLSSSPDAVTMAAPLKETPSSIHSGEQADDEADDADLTCDEDPSSLVDRVTPPPPLTPVNSLGMPAGSVPADFLVTNTEEPEDEEEMEAAVEGEVDYSMLLAEPLTPDIAHVLQNSKDDGEEDMEEDELMDATNDEDDDTSDEEEAAEDEEMIAEVEKEPEEVATSTSDDTTHTAPPPAPFDPSMRPIDVVFSFDTTGSMSSCIERVQQQLKEIITRLFMDVPNLKIGVIAHGDYCDAEHFYVSELCDLSNDLDALAGFVSSVSGTGGGDFPECYELVLQRARTDIKWRHGSQRALVMIGDAVPHDVADNPGKIDWRAEVADLRMRMGVRIYGVQCQAAANPQSHDFWRELAQKADGKHVKLEKFATIVDLIMAVVYREFAPDALVAYEREVRAREPITKDLNHMFAKLKGAEEEDDDVTATSSDAPLPSTSTTTTIIVRDPWKPKGRKTPAKPRTPAAKRTRVTRRTPTRAPVTMRTPARAPATRRTPARAPVTMRTPARALGAGLRSKMLLRPKRYTPPQNLRMKLRSTAGRGRQDTSLCYLDNHGKSQTAGGHRANNTPLRRVDTISKPHTPRVVNRESVQTTRLLSQLTWSPWKLAMTSSADVTTGDPSLVTGFAADKHKAAIYEVAVGTRDADPMTRRPVKYHVMYAKVTKGVPEGRSWHRYVFEGKALSEQINNVIGRGCTVHIRRAFLPTTFRSAEGKVIRTVTGIRSEVRGHISYAWLSKTSASSPCRMIKRDGQIISS